MILNPVELEQQQRCAQQPKYRASSDALQFRYRMNHQHDSSNTLHGVNEDSFSTPTAPPAGSDGFLSSEQAAIPSLTLTVSSPSTLSNSDISSEQADLPTSLPVNSGTATTVDTMSTPADSLVATIVGPVDRQQQSSTLSRILADTLHLPGGALIDSKNTLHSHSLVAFAVALDAVSLSVSHQQHFRDSFTGLYKRALDAIRSDSNVLGNPENQIPDVLDFLAASDQPPESNQSEKDRVVAAMTPDLTATTAVDIEGESFLQAHNVPQPDGHPIVPLFGDETLRNVAGSQVWWKSPKWRAGCFILIALAAVGMALLGSLCFRGACILRNSTVTSPNIQTASPVSPPFTSFPSVFPTQNPEPSVDTDFPSVTNKSDSAAPISIVTEAVNTTTQELETSSAPDLVSTGSPSVYGAKALAANVTQPPTPRNAPTTKMTGQDTAVKAPSFAPVNATASDLTNAPTLTLTNASNDSNVTFANNSTTVPRVAPAAKLAPMVPTATISRPRLDRTPAPLSDQSTSPASEESTSPPLTPVVRAPSIVPLNIRSTVLPTYSSETSTGPLKDSPPATRAPYQTVAPTKASFLDPVTNAPARPIRTVSPTKVRTRAPVTAAPKEPFALPTSFLTPGPGPAPTLPKTTTPVQLTSAPAAVPTLLYEEQLVAFINKNTLTGQYVNETGGSPEDNALHWMLYYNPLPLLPDTPSNQFRVLQRYALVTLWNQQVSAIEEGDECDWEGIFCAALDVGGTSVMSVSEIDLSGLNWPGQIAVDLGLLSTLVHFDMSTNYLVGSLPSSIGLWKSLESFDVSANGLTGSLPRSVDSWTSLVDLNLSGNLFTGGLPDSMEALTSLQSALLYNNDFAGDVPMGACTSIYRLTIVVDCTEVICNCDESCQCWPN